MALDIQTLDLNLYKKDSIVKEIKVLFYSDQRFIVEETGKGFRIKNGEVLPLDGSESTPRALFFLVNFNQSDAELLQPGVLLYYIEETGYTNRRIALSMTERDSIASDDTTLVNKGCIPNATYASGFEALWHLLTLGKQNPFYRRKIIARDPKSFNAPYVVPSSRNIPQIPFAYKEDWPVEDELRIGYTHLAVEASTITVTREADVSQVPLLRSNNTIKRGHGHSTASVTIPITFLDIESLEKLPELIRQVRKCPFLPVQNLKLNSQDIDALAIVSINISTVENLPGQIQAVIHAVEFDWRQYFPDEQILSFSDLFCWPLFKLWCERKSVRRPDSFPEFSAEIDYTSDFVIKTISVEALKELAAFEKDKASNTFQNPDIITDGVKAKQILEDQSNRSLGKPLQGNVILRTLKVPENTGRDRSFKTFKYYEIKAPSLPTLKKAQRYFINGWKDFPQSRASPPEVIIYKLNNSLFSQNDANQLFTSDNTELITTIPYLIEDAIPKYLLSVGPLNKEILDYGANYGTTGSRKYIADNYVMLVREDSDFLRNLSSAGSALKQIKFLGRDVAVDTKTEEELYVQWDFNWIVENVGAEFSNNFGVQQPKGEEKVLLQYLGSGDRVVTINGVIDKDNVNQIKEFWDYVNRLAINAQIAGMERDYKAFVKIENNIAKAMGMEWAIPIEFEDSTIPGLPSKANFKLTFLEFNPSQSKREQIEDLVPEVNPSLETLENQKELKKRFSRYLKIEENLKKLELYPDLDLPTYSELDSMIRELNPQEPSDFVKDHLPEYLSTEYRTYLAELRPGTGEVGFVDPDFFTVSKYSYTTETVKEMIRLWHKDVGSQPVKHTGTDGLKGYLKSGKLMKSTSDIPLSPDGTPPTPDQKSRLDAYNSLTSIGIASKERIVAESVDQRSAGLVSTPGGRFPEIPFISESSYDTVGTVGFKTKSDLTTKRKQAGFNPSIQEARESIISLTTLLSKPRGGWGPAEYKPSPEVLKWNQDILNAASESGIDPSFILASIHAESNGVNLATNSAGYTGLTQINGTEAKAVGFNATDITDPVKNIRIFGKLVRAISQAQFIPGYYGGVKSGNKPVKSVPVLAGKLNGGQNLSPQNLGKNSENRNHITRVTTLYLIYKLDFLSKAISSLLATKGNSPRERSLPENLLDALFEVFYLGGALARGENPLNLILNLEPLSFYTDVKFNTAGYIPTESPVTRQNSMPKEYVTRGDVYDFKLEESIEQGALFEDHIENEKRNRLITAYPCYVVFLIDGGRWLGYYRIFDRLFGTMGVSDMEIYQSRENPGYLAQVTFSNMYNKLSNQLSETDRLNKAGENRWTLTYIGDVFSQIFNPEPTEELLRKRAQVLNSILLKAGSRMHIRMGYGSDATKLPVVFNGTIMEVPVADHAIKVIAQGDGAELEKEIPPSVSTPVADSQGLTYEVTALAGAGKDPRSIIMEMFLSTSESVIGDLAYRISQGKYVHNNLYGIENFGRPSFGTDISSGLIPQVNDGEIGVNIYEPRRDPMNRTDAYSNFIPWLWSDSDIMCGISVENATPWKVIETCRKVVPDFVANVRPFGLRSTLFYGKPYWPYFYDYDYDKIKRYLNDEYRLDPRTSFFKQEQALVGGFEAAVVAMVAPGALLGTINNRLENAKTASTFDEFIRDKTNISFFMKRKSFLQIRQISSEHNLLENKIAASKEELYTAAQVSEIANLYGTGRSYRGSSLKYFDSEVYTENIRIKSTLSNILVRTGSGFGEGFKNLLAITPGFKQIDDLTEEGFNGKLFSISSAANENVALSELKDGLKVMYRGGVLIKGDASYRPYNLISLIDTPKKMTGVFEAREVLHSFNSETGFTTTITPDLCVSLADPFIPQLWMLAARWGAGYYLQQAAAKYLAMYLKGLWRDLFSIVDKIVKAADGDPKALTVLTNQLNLVLRPDAGPLSNPRTPSKGGVKIDENLPALWKNTEAAGGARRVIYVFSPEDLKILQDTAKEIIEEANKSKLFRLLPAAESRVYMGARLYEKLLRNPNFTNTGLLALLATVAEKVNASPYQRIFLNILRSSGGSPAGVFISAGADRLLLEGRVPSSQSRNFFKDFKAGFAAGKAASFRGLPSLKKALDMASKVGNVLKILGVIIGTDSLGELLNRKLGARKSAIVAPLRINGREFSAGIEGHRGGVIGDPVDVIDSTIRGFFNWGYSVNQLSTSIYSNDGLGTLGNIARSAFAGAMWVIGLQVEDPTEKDFFEFGDEQIWDALNIPGYLTHDKIRSTRPITNTNIPEDINRPSFYLGTLPDVNLRVIKWESENRKDLTAVNKDLLKDLAYALTELGYTATISAAISDHGTSTVGGNRSRHSQGNALDIGMINDIPLGLGTRTGTASDTNPKAKQLADNLVAALERLGYQNASASGESGKDKAFIWYANPKGAGNHYNHIHISRISKT